MADFDGRLARGSLSTPLQLGTLTTCISVCRSFEQRASAESSSSSSCTACRLCTLRADRKKNRQTRAIEVLGEELPPHLPPPHTPPGGLATKVQTEECSAWTAERESHRENGFRNESSRQLSRVQLLHSQLNSRKACEQ